MRLGRTGFVHLAMLAALTSAIGCAETTGGTAAVDATTSGNDTTGGNDATTGTDTTTGGDTATGGTAVTIEDMQKEMEKVDCTAASNGFTNGPKGVTIKGAVLATPINFKIDKAGKLDAAYIQTKGGGLWNGIYITGANGGTLGKLKVGDVIDLTGDVTDYYCATQITTKTITKVEGATELPVAVTLTLSQIGGSAAPGDNEATEGVYVSIENVVVSDNEPKGTDGKPHGDFFVGKDDKDKAVLITPGFSTTFSKKGADELYSADFPVGKKFKSIRGVIKYDFGAYKLVPLGDAALHAE